MKNQRKIFSGFCRSGFTGAAFAGLLGIMAANCGGKSANPTPGNAAGAGGGAGASGSGGGTAGGGGSTPDASVSDGGDAATACDPGASPGTASCSPCAANPLYACGPMGLVVTCIPFQNSTIPANIPRL
jgi:hypothetical protein